MYHLFLGLFFLGFSIFTIFYRILHKKQDTALNGAWAAIFLMMAIKNLSNPLSIWASQFWK